jgi:hypothetical protein
MAVRKVKSWCQKSASLGDSQSKPINRESAGRQAVSRELQKLVGQGQFRNPGGREAATKHSSEGCDCKH